MKLPNNILEAHLIKAANRIIEEGIPNNAHSSTYDVVYNGEYLPPKLIVSYANIFANDKELDRSNFKGGKGTESFALLESNGFVIEKKKSTVETQFRTYLKRINKEGSNKASSYFRAIELLNNIINRKGKDIFPEGKSIWEIDSVNTINSIYNFIIDQNKLDENGIFEGEKPSSYWKKGFYSAAINSYKNFLIWKSSGKILDNSIEDNDNTELVNMKMYFDVTSFAQSLESSGLIFPQKTITRFIASLTTKPFVLLSGLSGSGKTKLAQAFAQWICQDDSQYKIIPVGADWTNREPLLGYPNALNNTEYIKPDNGALDLIINANNNPELPYFLILDEMNLSHVERYFADFLSVMESGDEIPLFAEGTVENGVPSKLQLPSNLFIVGTVNIDETTYMFSPKVLDRANAIEFRVTKDEIASFFESNKELNMSKLEAQGASMAKSFLSIAENKTFEEQSLKEVHKTLVNFFEQLKKTGAEFGYRSANEIIRLINQLTVVDKNNQLSTDEKVDIAIMQKLLPKLHGSRRKLSPVLVILGEFCLTDKNENIEKEVFLNDTFDFEDSAKVKYPLSLEKIARMYNGAIDNGFASYAEA